MNNQDIKKLKILILGGEGYLGSVLIPELSKKFDITSCDVCIFGKNNKVKLIKKNYSKLNVNDLDAFNYVIDLANISNDPASELNKNITFKNNYFNKKKFFSKLNKKTKFIYISSCSVYGNFENKLAEVTSKTNPLSSYSKCCVLFENFLKKQKKNKFVIVRLGTLYGPSKRMRYDIAINLILRNLIFKKKVSIYGGKQYRLFCFIEIATRSIQKIISKFNIYQNKTYNVGNKNIRIDNLINKLQKIKLISNKIKIIKYNKDDNRSYKVKISNFGLNYDQNYFNKSIKKTYKFIKKDKTPFSFRKVTLNVYKKLILKKKNIL